jgi:hypothetical protein
VTRKPKPPPGPPEGSERRTREHRDGGFIMEIDGVVDFDSEAERTGTPSLVGQRLPPQTGRRSDANGAGVCSRSRPAEWRLNFHDAIAQ